MNNLYMTGQERNTDIRKGQLRKLKKGRGQVVDDNIPLHCIQYSVWSSMKQVPEMSSK